jgi:Glycopeptide antibiotics resistance protein
VSRIIEYIVKMLPFMLIALPVIVILRVVVFKAKKRTKLNLRHEIACVLFFMFMVGLSSQTFAPVFESGADGTAALLRNNLVNANFIPFKVFADTYREVFVNGRVNYFIINFLGNVIMFAPIGFFVPLLWDVRARNVILTGFLYSFAVEFSQLFIGRGTDVDDLWLNTLGTLLGFLIYKLLSKKIGAFMRKFRYGR